jgi:hypothetical protein
MPVGFLLTDGMDSVSFFASGPASLDAQAGDMESRAPSARGTKFNLASIFMSPSFYYGKKYFNANPGGI